MSLAAVLFSLFMIGFEKLRACLETHKTEWYHPVFITHDPKLVGPTEEQLFGFCDSYSVTQFSWFCDSKKGVIVRESETHFSCFHNLYSITQWQFCNIAKIVGPKSQALSHPTGHSLSLSFFFFFPFLLYFSFFLSLFFFIYSSLCSSSKQKAHTHRPLTRWPLTRRPK